MRLQGIKLAAAAAGAILLTACGSINEQEAVGTATTSFRNPDASWNQVATEDLSADEKTTAGSRSGKRCQRHHKRGCRSCVPKRCLKVTGICNLTERFTQVGDCCAVTADVIHIAQVKFDGNRGDKSGVEVSFLRNGQEVGRALTNAQGRATLVEPAVPRGPHDVTVEVTAPGTACTKSRNDCGCKENPCSTCSSVAENGKYSSSRDIAVYTDCIEGAVTGTGYIPTCDPLRVGLRDGFNFRITYDDGAVQGRMNYSGGQYAGAWKVQDAPVKWLVIAGNETWFGGDNWMAHAVDNGPTYTDDFFEIWIDDPAACLCYHCGGKLVGCYVQISYRYSQPCP